MINRKFFTLPKEGVVQKFFNGQAYKPTENGVFFVCHTDTVHKELPKRENITDFRGILQSSVGLGADDRCGCYITRRLMDIFPECGYLISSDEETGDTEFMKGCPDLVADGLVKPKVFISFDRKGIAEYVDYDHRSKVIETFLQSIGIARAIGSRSTCKNLSEKYKVPCVNLCFGADGFHTKSEYVDTFLMERLFEVYIGLVKFVLKTDLDYEEPKAYVYPVSTYGSWYGGYQYRPGSWWDDDGDDGLDLASARKLTLPKKSAKQVKRGAKDYLADDHVTCTVDGKPCTSCKNYCYLQKKHDDYFLKIEQGELPIFEVTPDPDDLPSDKSSVPADSGYRVIVPEFKSGYSPCDICGQWVADEELTEFNDTMVCHDCMKFYATGMTSETSDMPPVDAIAV